MLPYVLIAGACGVAVVFLLVVGLCEAACAGDEQLESTCNQDLQEPIIWPEFAEEPEWHQILPERTCRSEARVHQPQRSMLPARRGDR